MMLSTLLVNAGATVARWKSSWLSSFKWRVENLTLSTHSILPRQPCPYQRTLKDSWVFLVTSTHAFEMKSSQHIQVIPNFPLKYFMLFRAVESLLFEWIKLTTFAKDGFRWILWLRKFPTLVNFSRIISRITNCNTGSYASSILADAELHKVLGHDPSYKFINETILLNLSNPDRRRDFFGLSDDEKLAANVEALVKEGIESGIASNMSM